MKEEPVYPDPVTGRTLTARLFGASQLHVVTETGQEIRVLGPGKPMLLVGRLLHAP